MTWWYGAVRNKLGAANRDGAVHPTRKASRIPRTHEYVQKLLVSTWYCSYCCETESLDLVFLMMSKEEGFYVQERPSYINVLGRKSVSGSEC